MYRATSILMKLLGHLSIARHRYNDPASWHQPYILELEIMIRSNMAAAHIQLGRYKEAELVLRSLLINLLLVGKVVCDASSTSAASAWGDFAFLQDMLQLAKQGNEQYANAWLELQNVPEGEFTPSALVVDEDSLRTSCSSLEPHISALVSHMLNIARATCGWAYREVSTLIFELSSEGSCHVSSNEHDEN